MADDFGMPTPGAGTPTTQVAKDQAAEVGHGAADAGKHVAGVAGEQASGVAAEAADQARNLFAQTRDELRGQAASQQDRLAGQIRSLSSELTSMADRGNAGTASDLVREVAGRAHDVAGWLEQRDPSSLLQEVTDYARRRPGTFLAIAAGAGLVAGRLTRGAVSSAGSAEPAPAQAGSYDPAPFEPIERLDVDNVESTPFEETVPGSSVHPDRREGL